MCTYKKKKRSANKIWPAGKKVELMCLCVSDLQECKYCKNFGQLV